MLLGKVQGVVQATRFRALPYQHRQNLWSASKWFAFGFPECAEVEREDNNDTEQFSHQQWQK